MSQNTLSLSQLKLFVERKAFAHGVSPVVSTILGEYVVDILKTQPYVHSTKSKQLV